MPLVLADAWLGRRVVVRRALHRSIGGAAGPAHTDVLGDLVGLSATEATIETRTETVTVARVDIALARLVEASTADQLRLEAVAARGWRAEQTAETADGWLLRADHGWTGRANSALALRTVGRGLDAVLEEVAQWYAARNLPARIQVPVPAAAALDRALAGRGWTSVEDVDVLTARLDLLSRRPARRRGGDGSKPDPGVNVDVAVETADRPTADWLGAYHYRGGALPAGARELLARHDRPAFLSARAGREVLGIARAVVDGDWLGLTAVEVTPAHRRRGVATAVLAAATSWGVAQGARRAYLQVSRDNVGAIAFYASLGFHRHHSYRYRNAPTIDP